MSDLVLVRFLRDFGRYRRGDMDALPSEEVPRLLVQGVVALMERHAPVETATVAPPEMAVQRRRAQR